VVCNFSLRLAVAQIVLERDPVVSKDNNIVIDFRDEDGSELTLKGNRPMSVSDHLQFLQCKENKEISKRAI